MPRMRFEHTTFQWHYKRLYPLHQPSIDVYIARIVIYTKSRIFIANYLFCSVCFMFSCVIDPCLQELYFRIIDPFTVFREVKYYTESRPCRLLATPRRNAASEYIVPCSSLEALRSSVDMLLQDCMLRGLPNKTEANIVDHSRSTLGSNKNNGGGNREGSTIRNHTVRWWTATNVRCPSVSNCPSMTNSLQLRLHACNNS